MKKVEEVLASVGAVLTGSHFVYTKGSHGHTYVNKDALYPHAVQTSELCLAIAEQFADDGIETVVAPAVGGVILSQWIAYHLTQLTGREVCGVYAEKETIAIDDPDEKKRKTFIETGAFVFNRGYGKFVLNHVVLVAEDILNTGASAAAAVAAVRIAGGKVVGVGALCNRGKVTAEMLGNVPKLVTLMDAEMPMWPEADCPLCAENVPINTDVGKGREFLAKNKK